MNIFAFLAIVLVGSTLQAGTGFGFSIMATPFLLLLFEPHDAIQLNIILSLFLSVIMTYKLRKEVNKEMLIRLIKGSLIGVLPGLLLYTYLDARPMKIIVSIVILASTILLVAKVTTKQTHIKELLTGALSGLLTSSIGMPGPPLLIYFSGTQVDKANFRSTTSAYFIFIYSISLLLQFVVTNISTDILIPSLWALPLTIAGIYIGQWIFQKLDQQRFKMIIHLLLFITGVYLLLTTL